MLYFLYGEDTDTARVKAHDMVASLQKKRPDAALFKLTDENWSEASLQEYIGGQGLFSNKYIVHADGLLGVKDIKSIVAEHLKEIAESDNVFIMRDGSVDAATLKKLEKHATKVQEFVSKVEPKKKDDFNMFALTDAFGARDRKRLWMLYIQAKMSGAEDEQIHGMLFWQVKNLLLAQSTKSAKEAGLNPFVYSKAQGYARNFAAGELARISKDLVTLYHESRRGTHDLSTALERFMLL